MQMRQIQRDRSHKVIADERYASLLGEDWFQLPWQVQTRFSKHFKQGYARLYEGRVVETKLNMAGLILGQLARFIGGPLPFQNGLQGAASVMVTEDPQVGGQIWSRIYERRGRFPQIISSAKRFAGPTGLEEYVGAGIGMALKLKVEQGALLFISDHYFLQMGRFRLRWPRFLEPGRMVIQHQQETEDEFSFTLTLDHLLLGQLVYQQAYFKEV